MVFVSDEHVPIKMETWMKSRRAQVWRESADVEVPPTLVRRGLNVYCSDHMPQDAPQGEKCIHSEKTTWTRSARFAISGQGLAVA